MDEKISRSEKRFREGQGKRYTKDGRIRCQAVSKAFLRKIRDEKSDPNIKSDDVWPRGQCNKSAAEGYYLCPYHGGRSRNANRHEISDYLPPDMYALFEKVRNSPSLLSRYEDIAILKSRTVQLLERAAGLNTGPKIARLIAKGVEFIEQGDINRGVLIIKKAVTDMSADAEIWDEIRKNSETISKLHNTQVATEKELRQNLTREQYIAALNYIYQMLLEGAQEVVTNQDERSKLLTRYAGGIRQLIGTGFTRVVDEARVLTATTEGRASERMD